MIDHAPDYPPPFWAAKASYSNIPIQGDGPVRPWVDQLVGPHGYTWEQVNEWRWVGGDIPFAQFVCQRPDGGRDWLTITYVAPPPTAIDQHPTTRLL